MRHYAERSRSKFGSGTPNVFRPPGGGAAYFGAPYRWRQALEYRHWAFVAIRTWMMTSAGGAPPNLGRVIRDESDGNPSPMNRAIHKIVRKNLKGRVHSKALGGPQQHERFEPFEWNDPMRKVFRNPNGPDVAFDLWCWHYMFKKLMGQSYWWVRRNQHGVPKEIWVLPTHWVRLEVGHDSLPSSYFVQSPFGYAARIPFDEVVTFYEHSPLNRYEGYATNQAIGDWIDTYEASTRARLAQYKNGAIPAFHVQLGETYGDPDQAQLERYYTKLDMRFRGEGNTNRPIITGSDVDIKALGISPVDMAYGATEDQIRDMVLCAYGIPKVMVGLVDSMTYGSIAAACELFFQTGINPDLKYTGEVITEKIIAATGELEGMEHYKDGSCFWDERTANDPDMKLAIANMRSAHGSWTPNQERTMFGDEPFEHGGDDPLVNGQEMPWATGGRDEVQEAIAATGNEEAVKAQADVSKQVMEMQRAVTAGEMSHEMAVSNAQHVFGFDMQQAQELFKAAERQQVQDGANLTQAFQRALNSNSGGAGGYTIGGRLKVENNEYERAKKSMRGIVARNGHG